MQTNTAALWMLPVCGSCVQSKGRRAALQSGFHKLADGVLLISGTLIFLKLLDVSVFFEHLQAVLKRASTTRLQRNILVSHSADK